MSARGGYPSGVLGRAHGDSDRLFPRVTNASAACTGEVEINGKTLKLWTYQQLDSLNILVLRQRAIQIRDAVGEQNCPPLPSGHTAEMVRWILHMQSEITNEELGPGRHGELGQAPAHFLQETQARPITHERAPSPAREPMPFGPRAVKHSGGGRDHYKDIKLGLNEFKEVQTVGITTQRPGGEGRKYIPHPENMVSPGVSSAAPRGIQTMKEGGEGRRYLTCEDNMTKILGGEAESSPSRRSRRPDAPHMSDTQMTTFGTSAPEQEPHIGEHRRRHLTPGDHMVGHGTSEGQDRIAGRKHMDHFTGARANHTDRHGGYQSSWKRDPSRLQGTSLLV